MRVATEYEVRSSSTDDEHASIEHYDQPWARIPGDIRSATQKHSSGGGHSQYVLNKYMQGDEEGVHSSLVRL